MRFLEKLKGLLGRAGKELWGRRGRPVARRRKAGGREGTDQSLMFVRLADRYLRLGMLDTALQICSKGLAVNPDDLDGLVAISRVYLAKGMMGEARATAERLRTVWPSETKVSALWEELEKREASATRSEPASEGLEAAPVPRKIRTGEIASDTLAEYHLRKGNIEKAIDIYEEIFRRKPHNRHVEEKIAELRTLKISQTEAEGALRGILGDDVGEGDSEVASEERQDAGPPGIGSGASAVEDARELNGPREEGLRAYAQVRALSAWLDRIRAYRQEPSHPSGG